MKLLKMNNAHMAVFVKFLFVIKYICVERCMHTHKLCNISQESFFFSLHGMSHVIHLVTVMI